MSRDELLMIWLTVEERGEENGKIGTERTDEF